MKETEKHIDTTGLSRGQTPKEYFHRLYGDLCVDRTVVRNEDGSGSDIEAYELLVSSDLFSLRRAVTNFGLNARAAGYRQALAPVASPSAVAASPDGRPVSAIYFFLERRMTDGAGP